MILVLSKDNDTSSDVVISWLKFYKQKFVRINSFDLFESDFFLDISANEFRIGNNTFSFDDINAIWFRKFGFYAESDHFKVINSSIGYQGSNHVTKEFSIIFNALFALLQNKKWLTNPKNASLNKLNILEMAKSVGLKIPKTYVLSSKDQLEQLMKRESVITKSVYDPRFMYRPKGMYSMYTSRIENEDLEKLPSRFFPSLIQGEIKKKYEIRSFFLIDQFYSMAIFSQEAAQTEVDFRRYNWQNPNRFLPYSLPSEIENKISKMLLKLNINCASIDLIKGTDGEYYFLEINVNGQFGMVDFSCNYGLHKKVAELLTSWNNHN